jgi:hypothetical protein
MARRVVESTPESHLKITSPTKEIKFELPNRNWQKCVFPCLQRKYRLPRNRSHVTKIFHAKNDFGYWNPLPVLRRKRNNGELQNELHT